MSYILYRREEERPLDVVKEEGYENIFSVDCFCQEFRQNVCMGSNKGDAKRYVDWLARSLRVLDVQKERAILLSNFEKVDSDGIYSIRYPNAKRNPRVLYFFVHEGVPVLLSAFLEKSKSDYTRSIDVSKARANYIKAHWEEF